MKHLKRFLILSFLILFAVVILGNDSGLKYAREQIQALSGYLSSYSIGSGFSLKTSGAESMSGTGILSDQEMTEAPANTGEEYTFDEKIYPYYAMLTNAQKSVYCQIYANALVQNDSFVLTEFLSESELADTACAVYNDHPELFWLETAYSYHYNSWGQVVSMQLSYYMTGSVLEQARNRFTSAVETLVLGASSYATQIEQELYVHDAINDMTAYNTNAEMSQSAYSALVTGHTVCAGYARAFQYVMQQLGYCSYYCTGSADGGDHAWNIIEIEGNFYNVDLTWDDSISEAYGAKVYTYFNLTDSAISADHTRSALSAGLPSCTCTDMAYTNVFGSTISIDDIEVESGTHTKGDMIITPSAPEIVDWKNTPADQAPENSDMEITGNNDPEDEHMNMDRNELPEGNTDTERNKVPTDNGNMSRNGNQMQAPGDQTMPSAPEAPPDLP